MLMALIDTGKPLFYFLNLMQKMYAAEYAKHGTSMFVNWCLLVKNNPPVKP